jgi:hypothetical protein
MQKHHADIRLNYVNILQCILNEKLLAIAHKMRKAQENKTSKH